MKKSKKNVKVTAKVQPYKDNPNSMFASRCGGACSGGGTCGK